MCTTQLYNAFTYKMHTFLLIQSAAFVVQLLHGVAVSASLLTTECKQIFYSAKALSVLRWNALFEFLFSSLNIFFF